MTPATLHQRWWRVAVCRSRLRQAFGPIQTRQAHYQAHYQALNPDLDGVLQLQYKPFSTRFSKNGFTTTSGTSLQAISTSVIFSTTPN